MKVQNVSECLSWWYLLSHRSFCYQTWYCYAASWARVSCRKMDSLSSTSRLTISTVSCKFRSIYNQVCVCVCVIISQSDLWKNWITAFRVKVSAKVHNISECLSGDIIWTAEHFDLSEVWLERFWLRRFHLYFLSAAIGECTTLSLGIRRIAKYYSVLYAYFLCLLVSPLYTPLM